MQHAWPYVTTRAWQRARSFVFLYSQRYLIHAHGQGSRYLPVWNANFVWTLYGLYTRTAENYNKLIQQREKAIVDQSVRQSINQLLTSCCHHAQSSLYDKDSRVAVTCASSIDYSSIYKTQWRNYTTSTQPCIPPGSLNRVPASAGGTGGTVTSAGWQVTLCDPCGMWVPVAVWQPCELLYTCYLLYGSRRPE